MARRATPQEYFNGPQRDVVYVVQDEQPQGDSRLVYLVVLGVVCVACVAIAAMVIGRK
ncbi:MAG: hypothetical protein PHZ19_02125 [Candidatus Thermoplasmatota archaeon]|nr:hypothetical protein [Candidatus Thermoplasmatota archaeon]